MLNGWRYVIVSHESTGGLFEYHMAIPLRLLLIGDSDDEAELIVRHLVREGYAAAPTRARTLATVQAALEGSPFDAILCAYTLPGFTARDALACAQAAQTDAPFLIWAGEIDVGAVVDSMKAGVHDFIRTDELHRLAPALARELRETEARRAHRQAATALAATEERLHAVVANSPLILFATDAQGVITLLEGKELAAVGLRAGQLIGQRMSELYNNQPAVLAAARQVLAGRPLTFTVEVGDELVFEVRASPARADGGAITGLIGVAVNVTEHKRVEAQAEHRLQHVQALRAIDSAITASFDLGGILQVVLTQVQEQLGVDAADVLLLNPETFTLTYAAGRGFRTAALQHTRLRIGESFAGLAALQRRTVNITDFREQAGAFMRSPLLVGEEFTSYFGTPLIAKGQVKGVLEVFNRAALTPNDEWLSFLETLAGQAAIALDNASLFEELQLSNIELTLAYESTIEGWSRALDLRDNETEGHSQRVTELTLRLAGTMGLADSELIHLRRGALLHDIGKMGIPDAILLKPGPLTDEEWAIMRKHPIYAQELIHAIAFLRPALAIPYYHHEKWDGSGYPVGLRGEAIPLAARIFAVVDVWDALRSDRPYRRAWPEDKVRTYLHEQVGRHFDPRVVAAFMELEPPLLLQ